MSFINSAVKETALRAKPDFLSVDFDRSPFLVIWEVTQACDLACLHCRAEAQSQRHPLELTTREGFDLINQVRALGPPAPLLVLTGGDPVKRPDVVELVRYGHDRGLRVAMTPSGTPLMTREVIQDLKAAGLSRLAVSLDADTADLHDRFRGVSGSFKWTMDTLSYAREFGLSLQINTTMTRYNLDRFAQMARKMMDLGIVLWSVFFLVPTGRGKAEDELSPAEYESVLERIYDVSKTASFDVKTTAAPHYRRVVLQRTKQERQAGEQPRSSGHRVEGPGFSVGSDAIGRAVKGVNDGNGLVFVSHTGNVFPSGFLPVSAGNVRVSKLSDLYQYSALLRELRDPESLKGKCGACEFKTLCGGCRARAYAVTGDYLEADPFCAYLPRGFDRTPTDCVA